MKFLPIPALTLRPIVFFIFLSTLAFAQKKDKGEVSVKVGKISPTDFDPSIHAFDTTSDAVILYDKGTSSFRESPDGWFQLILKDISALRLLTKMAWVPPILLSSNTEVLNLRKSWKN